MLAAALLSCVLLLSFLRSRSAFLVLIATLHLTPALGYLSGALHPLNDLHYFLLSVAVSTILIFALPACSTRREDVLLLVLFCSSGSAFFLVFSQWEAMYPLGERIRDMALLTITDRNPLNPDEPWLPGYPVPYYLYWYRWARFFRYLVDGSYVTSYIGSLAFSAALLTTSAFAISRIIFHRSIWEALFFATIVTFGSNPAGVVEVLTQADTWWGPSRVVKGTITEFPAWSFLLGDAHPHVLNLGTSLFGFFLAFLAISSPCRRSSFITAAVLFVLLVTFLKAANPWEIPLWIGVYLSFLCVFFWRSVTAHAAGKHLLGSSEARMRSSEKENGLPLSQHQYGESSKVQLFLADSTRSPLQQILFWFLGLGASYALYSSVSHLPASGLGPSLVTPDIAKTTMRELFLHWGMPLGLIAAYLLVRPLPLFYRLCFLGLSLAALFGVEARLFLLVLLGFQIIAFFYDYSQEGLQHPSLVALHILLILFIAYILGPEFIFLDDPYGGENERMNTIFKIYSFTWAPFLLFSGLLVSGLTDSLTKRCRSALRSTALLIGLIFLLFFGRVALTLRSPVTQITNVDREFSVLEERYPGISDIIQRLRSLPVSIILEPQGPAYNYTSLLSSLSGHYSYLGWANHVNLLTKQYAEVQRRQKVSSLAYNPAIPCATRKEMLKREKIDFIALGFNHVGPLRAQRGRAFACFEEVLASPSMRIVAVE